MKSQIYEKMHETESFHWWFCGKREIVLSLIKDKVIKNNSKSMQIIDFGCGCGLMLGHLEQFGVVTGVDFSEQALEYCKIKFDGRLLACNLSEEIKWEEKFDLAVALDIVEHIENDSAVVKNIFNALNMNGEAILTVPALQFLWSDHDENCMHIKRYNLSKFKTILEKAGFTIEYISYYNFFLFPIVVLLRLTTRFLRINKNSGLENDIKDNFINKILYRIFSTEKFFIKKGIKLPIGVSLIALVSKRSI